ncbi:MAG TPA: tail fiber domain-containing protein [Terriglobales bacterium]|nr:tail fiber domain-containing protein [Terriglobales bacterium]
MTGNANTAFGAQTFLNNTTGNSNVAVGANVLYSNTTGYYNTAIGSSALDANSTGNNNTAIGVLALSNNSTGTNNTATGSAALDYNTGSNNTANGALALYLNTTGIDDDATGFSALANNTTGFANAAGGAFALFNNTTGSYNTALGFAAGPDSSSTNLANSTAIGANAVVSESNALILGGTGTYAVKVGIGTATPSNVFTIAQGAGHAISDSWDTYSSRRWKTNIQTLDGALSKVERLRGVSYELKDGGKREIGVIAEEVNDVVPEVVSKAKDGNGVNGVDYSRLTALLIEATKEQQREIQRERAQIAKLVNEMKRERAMVRDQAVSLQNLKSELTSTRETLRTVKSQTVAAQPTLVAAK